MMLGESVKVDCLDIRIRQLTCITTLYLTDNHYIWYKNGQHLDERRPLVLGQIGWSVTYTTQSICALKGSTVELSCSYTYPSGHTITTTFWFTKMERKGKEPDSLGQDPEYAGRLEYHGDKKKDCTLRITDLRESDSATYKFRFITDKSGGRYYGDPGVTLSVTGLQVKVTGETLTCITTCTLTDNPTYIWYKNGTIVKEGTSSLYSDSFNDADSYSCAVKGRENLHSPAVCLQVKVCIMIDTDLYTSCTLTDNPTYIWYKNALQTLVFLWVPVVGVGAFLTVGALLVTIYCTLKRRSTGGSDATTDTHSVHHDPNSDTYTGLNMKTWSPDYDTLESVHPDPNSDMCTVMKKKTRSPE
nr:uncharacterized protein LOC111953563 [Salvelinus alpinus]